MIKGLECLLKTFFRTLRFFFNAVIVYPKEFKIQLKPFFVSALYMYMKNAVKLILLLLVPYNGLAQSDAVDEYYNEICHYTEFSGKLDKPFKFKEDVYIYVVQDNKPDYLMKELYKVVEELNDLIESVEIYITYDRNKENALVYFGDPDEYVEYMDKPYRRKFLKSNWGAAWITPHSYNEDEIGSVDIFINTNVSN